jgi:hypothetical protein
MYSTLYSQQRLFPFCDAYIFPHTRKTAYGVPARPCLPQSALLYSSYGVRHTASRFPCVHPYSVPPASFSVQLTSSPVACGQLTASWLTLQQPTASTLICGKSTASQLTCYSLLHLPALLWIGSPRYSLLHLDLI